MILFISLTIAGLAMLLVLVVAAASSYPVPSPHVNSAQSLTYTTTELLP